ncbi:unnamed protein product [Oncorhynchus mykiss]|uniref:FACT complex subunit SSRP1/POB3 N-terminal PH domain-containing protein n=1 Tax=Oncorhynchus mykiss TaxID=8022 RepID=A0A060XTU9_ONCMY|nr:unnamed protein product [Oncorhynchus mykiss]
MGECLHARLCVMTYKSRKTGKVDSIPSVELSQAQWRRVCLGQGIKLTTSTGHQVDHQHRAHLQI